MIMTYERAEVVLQQPQVTVTGAAVGTANPDGDIWNRKPWSSPDDSAFVKFVPEAPTKDQTCSRCT
jgi:hypothetical protein